MAERQKDAIARVYDRSGELIADVHSMDLVRELEGHAWYEIEMVENKVVA